MEEVDYGGSFTSFLEKKMNRLVRRLDDRGGPLVASCLESGMSNFWFSENKVVISKRPLYVTPSRYRYSVSKTFWLVIATPKS